MFKINKLRNGIDIIFSKNYHLTIFKNNLTLVIKNFRFCCGWYDLENLSFLDISFLKFGKCNNNIWIEIFSLKIAKFCIYIGYQNY